MSEDYWICHNPLHVAKRQECSRTPYSSVTIYDPECHPMKLKLVGLASIDTEDLGEPPDQVTCINKAHFNIRKNCTTRAFAKDVADMAEMSGHKWVPLYKKGMYIVVRAKVVRDSTFNNDGVSVLAKIGSGNSTLVSRDDVFGYIDGPIPDEAERHLILKSTQSGLVFHHTDTWRELPAVNGTSYTWEELYNVHGPFDIFKPEGKI